MWGNKMAKVPISSARVVKPGEQVSASGIYKTSITEKILPMVEGEIAPETEQEGEVWIQAYDLN